MKRKINTLRVPIRWNSIFEFLQNTTRVYTLPLDLPKIEDYKKIAGIYCFCNEKQQKIYIGSAKNLGQRIKVHLKGKETNKNLKNSIEKNGIESFSVIILEKLCPTSEIDKKTLLEREDYYLTKWPKKFLYNKSLKAGSNLGYRYPPEEVKRGKLSPNFGRKHTQKTKDYLSEIHKGVKNPMYGKLKSFEFQKWQGFPRFGNDNFMYRRGQALSVWTTHDDFIGEFKTIKQVVKLLKISKETIKKHYLWHQPYYPKTLVFHKKMKMKNRERQILGYWFCTPVKD